MIATSRAIARGRRGAVEAGQAKACAPGGPITAMQGKLKHNAAWFSYSTFAVFLTACNQRTNSTGPSVERGFQTSISRAILASDTMKWRCGAQTLRRLAGQALRERLLDSATWRLCKNRARKPSGTELKHAPPLQVMGGACFVSRIAVAWQARSNPSLTEPRTAASSIVGDRRPKASSLCPLRAPTPPAKTAPIPSLHPKNSAPQRLRGEKAVYLCFRHLGWPARPCLFSLPVLAPQR